MDAKLVGHQGANRLPEGVEGLWLARFLYFKDWNSIHRFTQRSHFGMCIARICLCVGMSDDLHAHFLGHSTIEHAAIESMPQAVE